MDTQTEEASTTPESEEDEFYKTSWTDWAYAPRIIVTPATPHIPSQSAKVPPQDQEDRKLGPRGVSVVRGRR